jgi:hypothetical protein
MLAAKRIPIGYELHVCSDAFELGFGTCVYLRAKYASGNYFLKLFMAKSRISPMRKLSMRIRLEMQGAVFGLHLSVAVITELGLIVSKIVYWCDSQTVLQWIHSTSCIYHAFLAYRVNEILESSSASQWRHILGDTNPSDDCSRGIPATHLTPHHRWFHGLDFFLSAAMFMAN